MSINFTFAKRHVCLTFSSDLEKEHEHKNYLIAQEQKKVEYSGELGTSGRSKIRKIVECFAQSLRFKDFEEKGIECDVKKELRFITLTLPAKQKHSDKFLNRNALGRFLVAARRKFKMERYVWRAETQDNGNLHYHIITDVFIPYLQLREIWNKIMTDLEYVSDYTVKMKDKYKKGFVYSSKKLSLEQKVKESTAYQKGVESGWSNPNSTDIHNLDSTDNPEAYISKYMSKEGTGRGVWAQKWGCSDNLRDLEQYKIAVDMDTAKVIIEEMEKACDMHIEKDFCTIYTFKKWDPVKILGRNYYESYARHHANQRKKYMQSTTMAEQGELFV